MSAGAAADVEHLLAALVVRGAKALEESARSISAQLAKVGAAPTTLGLAERHRRAYEALSRIETEARLLANAWKGPGR